MHVDEAVRRVLRIEGKRKQTRFALGSHTARDVEERRGKQGAVLHDANAPRPLGDEKARVVERSLQIYRAVKASGTADDLQQPKIGPRIWQQARRHQIAAVSAHRGSHWGHRWHAVVAV